MKISLFGTKIYISFPFCAVFSLMILVDKTGLFLPTVISAGIHEAGHLFALWAYDSPPARIDLILAGVRITKRNSLSSNPVVCALSGPLINLAVSFCFWLNYIMYKKEYILTFAVINAALCFFNLIPAFGLDGGTVLISVLEKKIPHLAVKITQIVSFLFAAAFLVLGVFLYRSGAFNFSVFIAAFYLMFCAVCMVRE